MYLKKFLMTMAAALCMLPLSAINPQNSKMKELNAKPKSFLFKHAITNNYIYVTKPKKFIGYKENQIKKMLTEWTLTENYDAKWIVEDEVFQFSPSSMTKKILKSI